MLFFPINYLSFTLLNKFMQHHSYFPLNRTQYTLTLFHPIISPLDHSSSLLPPNLPFLISLFYLPLTVPLSPLRLSAFTYIISEFYRALRQSMYQFRSEKRLNKTTTFPLRQAYSSQRPTGLFANGTGNCVCARLKVNVRPSIFLYYSLKAND